MKTLLRIFACFILVSLLVVARSQKPIYPKPNGKQNIPFGKKIPSSISNDREQKMSMMYDKKMRDLPPAYFDRATNAIIQNRPGNKSFNSPSVQKGKLPQKKAYNTSIDAYLVKDINSNVRASDSYPENNPANSKYRFAVLNNVSYFSADDGIHNHELWRSDGTANGTYMVKDINPAGGSSGVNGIVAIDGLLYFSAFTDETGYEPWVSDGTEAGTHILKDISPGRAVSFPSQFVGENGNVYFVTDVNGYYHNQVWKTNGTEAGTTMVKDISPLSGIGYGGILELTVAYNMLYFIAATYNSGLQLFRSDGTEAGTYVVKETGYFGWGYEFSAPMQLTAYNNRLFFSVDDGFGRKLWESDGTFEGTHYAGGYNEILMQADYMDIYNNRPFPILNNQLFIAGYSSSDIGGGLYKYDASNDLGEVLVKDLTDLTDYPYDDVYDFVVPVDFVVVGNELCFKVISSIGVWHDELWRSGGESGNTHLVKNIGITDAGAYSYNFTDGGNGIMFFNVNNEPGIGNELWRSDGTEVGTVLVKDFYPGETGSYPDDLTLCNGKLLFRVNTVSNGIELGQSDGSEAGTSLLKDINTSTTNTESSDAGFMYKGIFAIGNDVLFNAFTPDLGGELYRSDGTAAGTVLLNDIATGAGWSYPNAFAQKNKLIYFIGDDAIGTALYATDGTPAGLRRVTAYIDRANYFVVNFNVADNGQIFYVLGYRNGFGYELWHSNGTELSGENLGASLYYDNNYTVIVGNTAFFVAGDFDHGFELWKSDGTSAGTKMVKDVFAGFEGSYPYSLFAFKGSLYFGAYSGGFAYSIWKSDGTESGTNKFADLTLATYYENFADPASQVFCISNGQLYFNATDWNVTGGELWKTDGTIEGTKLVKNINTNPYADSYPSELTDVNGTLYFNAYDGVHGRELWVTKGSEKSTALIRDITEGPSGTYVAELTGAGQKLFFLADGNLWSTGGDEASTNPIDDPIVTQLLGIRHLTVAGKNLFFGGDSYQYGRELFVGDASAKKFVANKVGDYVMEDKPGKEFDAVIYPNPSRSGAALQLSGDVSDIRILITDVSGRKMWERSFNDQHTIALPVSKLNAGIYMITVKGNNESKSLTLVRQ